LLLWDSSAARAREKRRVQSGGSGTSRAGPCFICPLGTRPRFAVSRSGRRKAQRVAPHCWHVAAMACSPGTSASGSWQPCCPSCVGETWQQRPALRGWPSERAPHVLWRPCGWSMHRLRHRLMPGWRRMLGAGCSAADSAAKHAAEGAAAAARRSRNRLRLEDRPSAASRRGDAPHASV
jgi:hypothetical protein